MENDQKIVIGGGGVVENGNVVKGLTEVVKSFGMKVNSGVVNGLGMAVQGQGKVIVPSAIGFKISDLSDEQLYKKCVECGMNAKEWIRKFAAMLPEVEKRGLYKKKGFVSIYDFAKRLAGMSEFTVDRILKLVKRIEDKPVLLRQFESGKQSWSKIETVSYIATRETDEVLARKVDTLPYRALTAYVSQKRREDASIGIDELKNKTLFGQNFSGGESKMGMVDGFRVGRDVNGVQLDLAKMFDGVMIDSRDFRNEERYKVFLFHASIDVQFKLRLFKQRLEKERKQSFSWNEVFEILLRRLEERRQGKDEKGKDEKEKDEKEKDEREENYDDNKEEKVVSRHIPVELKRQILAKYAYKCGFPKCNFPCFVLHHTKRFVLFRRHDAESIVPLCKKHHDLVHGGCIANEEDVPEKWVLKKAGGERLSANASVGKNVGYGGAFVGVVDKYTGEVLDTKAKVDAVVMKYKMRNIK
ncbi:MAG: HNH endonuclease signature motif containing protein [Candidatus Peregrinibacteria bacterium]|nr:HNH endonuclease signature motif containing protein [Candidatus Peregrinibacteria bacterium]